MRELLKDITLHDPKRLRKPILWNSLAGICSLLPFISLVFIIKQILRSFTGSLLEPASLCLACGSVFFFFLLAYFLENKACKVTYHDGYYASADGRVRLAERVRSLPIGFLKDRQSGEIGHILMEDFAKTETALTHILPQVISGLITAVVAFVFLLVMDWRMGLAAFIGLPLSYLILKGSQLKEARLEGKKTKMRVKQTETLQEYLYGMKTIKSYHLQGENDQKLVKACEDYRDACIHMESSLGSLNLLSSGLLRLGLSAMMLVGSYLIIQGSLTFERLALFLLLGSRVFDPLAAALMNYSELRISGLAGERICRLLEEKVMPGEESPGHRSDIEFQEVSFAYGGQQVLSHVSCLFRENEMTALVGPSGSGKSTMLRLAARFYDPQEGQVCFGGKALKEMDPEKLMQQIAMVFQEVYLFEDTVANNIRYGKQEATQKEIEEAAKMANCYDFIMKMEQGFDTVIGEGGSTLSGGEKQRISIARALLKNAPVVLLDEATASLDPENEAEIQEAISHLTKGRTVIVIAHRLKTIVDADQILLLDQGRIVASGKHEELLQKEGLYRKLWDLRSNIEGWKVEQIKSSSK